MEINSFNQPVNFYTKNTGNNINTVINEQNTFSSNFFSSEINKEKVNTNSIKPQKKRKSKRLNIVDNEYLLDEVIETNNTESNEENNFFAEQKKTNFIERFKKLTDFMFTSVPLINYFSLKDKQKRIQKTIKKLNDISQDVDDILTSTVPYGEESIVYDNITKNISNFANVVGEANKNINQ